MRWLTNSGKIPLELIAAQAGSYKGEDRIIRVEGIYDAAPYIDCGGQAT